MKKLLRVQDYLLQGKTPENLKEDFGIKFYEHPEEPLVGFKYCQINSPRSHPIVRECRGLVLERDSWRIVGKGFNRFFNVGELADEFKQFNWTDFNTYSKEDGSLVLVYNYKDEWHVNTSGSFGLGELDSYGGTWRDLFWETAPFDKKDLRMFDKSQTLVFELCTPYNKVVRSYRPSVYLLSIFDHRGPTLHADGLHGSYELCQFLVDDMADTLNIKRPKRYQFGSQEEVKDFLLQMEEKDSTFEGVILHDSNGMRYKWKTSTYLSLHRMKNNGNVLHPKNLVPIVLANEQHEVKAVMPECSTALDEVEGRLQSAYNSLEKVWLDAKDASSQKEFAMAVKEHPLCSLLFKLRKTNPAATVKDLEKTWRESGDQLVKSLFHDKRYKFDILEVE